jgi:hypothetical protein
MTYELQVRVSNGRAVATLDWGEGTERVTDAERGTTEIGDDRLAMETVRLLQQWLSRWRIISEVSLTYDKFPVDETFRILGEHLYQMVFAGAVGDGFTRSYQEAQAAGQPLRVMLSFAADSGELAALPWEFLYRRNDSGPSFYLATETKLVLNRFLPGTRRSMPITAPPLRLLFVMCVPRSKDLDQKDQMIQRAQVLRSIRNLKKSADRLEASEGGKRLDVRIVEDWDADTVDAELKWDPHVVHIVGHARYAFDRSGSRWRSEIELPGTDGKLEWSEPQRLVDLLTRGKSPDQLPRLAVLHLCEREPVDFTATFERLAPELIEAGLLSVLAMQYPMSVNAATKFTTTFYDRLAAGDEVDKIVQDARYDMSKEPSSQRLIGTPVLYMQSLGGRLVAEETEIPSDGKVDPHQVSTRAVAKGGRGIQQRLKAAAWSAATRKEQNLAEELVNWIEDNDWSDDTSANEQQIRQHMRFEDPYVSERGRMYMAMLEELSGGSDDRTG